MRQICLVLLAVTLAFTAYGQQSPIHNQTTAPINARFEIVQAQTAAKWTFRLDRYSGQVWQLVRTRAGGNAWEVTPVLDLPDGSNSARPHFQLFLSGLAAKHTFLIDVDSGRTWTLTAITDKSGKEAGVVWSRFEE
jgi:hypothetical protein